MFSKTDRPGEGPSGLPSIVSKDTTITGNVASPGTIQVEGTVIGDIECHELTLGETGDTNVSVAASATICGDIVHENISIEAHARVEGRLVRRDTQETKLNLVSDETV
jgi:cytoskeletal protein CcmA (bactofilin family)